MDAGHANIGEPQWFEPVGAQDGRTLISDGQVGSSSGSDHDLLGTDWRRRSPDQCRAVQHAAEMPARFELFGAYPGDNDWAGTVFQKLGDDLDEMIGTLSGPVHGLWLTLAKGSVVVDSGKSEVGERESTELGDGIIRRGCSISNRTNDAGEFVSIHTLQCGGCVRSRPHSGASRNLSVVPSSDLTQRRVGFLGPRGTFTEQALNLEPDLAAGILVPLRSMPDVLAAVEHGEVDLGFIAIENSIEGTVNVSQDELVFNHELLIQHEVVLDIEHCLLALPGTTLADIHVVLSIPVATAQCHEWIKTNLPKADRRAADSTAGAAQTIAHDRLVGVAAIAPRVAAELYGLDVVAEDIADHKGNQTRFVVVARAGIPAPTGHDKTSVVVFQRANEPGSLMSILAEFAARRINLTKLESRPTKAGGLGDYCFVIDAEGHISDEVLADALRDLHAKQGGVKFLGSYPAAGRNARDIRAHADVAWQRADDWVEDLRRRIMH